jgi:hypothetical protein
MITTTIVAVTLGVVPVNPDGTVRPLTAANTQMIGRVTERVDTDGVAHLSGYDRNTGQRFDITIDRKGNVEGLVGNMVVTFQVSSPSRAQGRRQA